MAINNDKNTPPELKAVFLNTFNMKDSLLLHTVRYYSNSIARKMVLAFSADSSSKVSR